MSKQAPHIDLSGLASFLAQFDEARDHLVRSQRELLLAMRAFVDALLRIQRERGIQEGATSALLVLRAVLDYLIARVPETGTSDAVQTRLDALAAVREVLDAEERRMEPLAGDELVAAKIDAIRAIRKVIDREMERVRVEARRKESRRVRKVRVE